MFNRVLNTHLDTVAKRCIHFCVSNTINAVSIIETITLNVQLTLNISNISNFLVSQTNVLVPWQTTKANS